MITRQAFLLDTATEEHFLAHVVNQTRPTNPAQWIILRRTTAYALPPTAARYGRQHIHSQAVRHNYQILLVHIPGLCCLQRSWATSLGSNFYTAL